MSTTSKTGKYVSGKFYSSVKYKANKRGIYFAPDLTIEFLDSLIEAQEFKCFYSGLPIDAKTRNHITASLDRRDSNGGYTRDNVQFLSTNCNMAKWIMNEEDFLGMVESIYINFIKDKDEQTKWYEQNSDIQIVGCYETKM